MSEPRLTLPLRYDDPFRLPRELRELRESDTARPVRAQFHDGRAGWLVGGHATVRAVLADNRFSARPELHGRLSPRSPEPRPAGPGMLIGMDPPDHTRYRRLLAGQFTVRRMRLLTERVREIVVEHLDAMAAAGPPAELVESFAHPVPAMVICELLGVPYEERARFEQNARTLFRADIDAEELMRAYGTVMAYVTELVASKQAEPTDDLLGGLAAGGELTEEELANIAFMLLGAGLDTTANMLGFGTFALLLDPRQIGYVTDPDTVDHAVEELLRYLDLFREGTVRTALEDVELAGVTIRAGETVRAMLAGGNRDPERFGDPDRMDLSRTTTGHLSFGHGVHQCLGQQLARVQMRVGFLELFQRFPGLRLAVEPDQVRMRDDMVIHGVHELPVEW